MYEIVCTNRMKHAARRMRRRGKDMTQLVASGNPLPAKYKDHQLTGNLHDFRECHIEPECLLLYQIFEDRLILSATAMGSHADLFGR